MNFKELFKREFDNIWKDVFFWLIIGVFSGIATFILLAMLLFKYLY